MLSRLLKVSVFVALLFLPLSAKAQDPGSSSASNASVASAAGTPGTSPKKVWTNEDLAGKGGVSVVGKRNQNYHMSSNTPADAPTVTRIKQNLQRLQTQLDDINAKLKLYKQFQDGEAVSSGSRDMSKGYSRTPVDQQMAQLQEKKKQLEDQIGDLMDEARKKGIDPGQLR